MFNSIKHGKLININDDDDDNDHSLNMLRNVKLDENYYENDDDQNDYNNDRIKSNINILKKASKILIKNMCNNENLLNNSNTSNNNIKKQKSHSDNLYKQLKSTSSTTTNNNKLKHPFSTESLLSNTKYSTKSSLFK